MSNDSIDLHITLDQEQMKVVESTIGKVLVRDQQGRLIGYLIPPPNAKDLAAAKLRLQSSGKWYSTQQVLDQLKSLEQG